MNPFLLNVSFGDPKGGQFTSGEGPAVLQNRNSEPEGSRGHRGRCFYSICEETEPAEVNQRLGSYAEKWQRQDCNSRCPPSDPVAFPLRSVSSCFLAVNHRSPGRLWHRAVLIPGYCTPDSRPRRPVLLLLSSFAPVTTSGLGNISCPRTVPMISKM